MNEMLEELRGLITMLPYNSMTRADAITMEIMRFDEKNERIV